MKYILRRILKMDWGNMLRTVSAIHKKTKKGRLWLPKGNPRKGQCWRWVEVARRRETAQVKMC